MHLNPIPTTLPDKAPEKDPGMRSFIKTKQQLTARIDDTEDSFKILTFWPFVNQMSYIYSTI
jgi:hypothetical protein